MIRQVKADEARKFFEHRSQKRGVLDPAKLHDDGLEYWVNGPVCGAAHRSFWPDVWMVHYGVLPAEWGNLDKPGRELLEFFWAERKPVLITGWTLEKNRLAVAFAKRCGFRENGRMTVPEGVVIMQEWRPEYGH